MIIFRNANYANFLNEISDKRIICYGAGGTLKDFLCANNGHIRITEKIEAILDNDTNISGKKIYINKRSVAVTTLSEFISANNDLQNSVILLLVSNKYIFEVIKQFDTISEFDGLVCYHGLTALDWGREIYPPLPLKPTLPTPKKNYQIPKIIHYCWFGHNKIPPLQQECIKSWGEFCPEYEMRLWNEETYDLSTVPIYVKQAYEAKKYAFVSDYVRLDVVYKFGGFYLDTDVELLKSIDIFSKYKSIFAFETYNLINTGLIFGSISNDADVKSLLDIYNNIIFKYEDNSFNMTACPYYHTDYFRTKKIQINNTLQFLSEVLFLPSDFFSPLCETYTESGTKELTLFALTDNTYGIHRYECSWFDKEQYNDYYYAKKASKAINDRLLSDWRKF
ncbi:MAG: hypothetical protein LBM93_15075 [Oscillospiraceae bacterium]|jgi:hypothetical protein|nr:hypothetical protein [Oscillospiraceae bacterium]